ncbi:alpha/beta fold hydrolase [Caldimonas brevitalea]|uniref:Hydrolase n=1 Tax=Caldimonas brevitalea TaxID=413882 RepID=A0A0G3BPM6_9BURK|nr:alpha/beta hydrolase [Caldimonas brevitalea]AKJ31362.1 hydrolase [Caldimonas brevitalea]
MSFTSRYLACEGREIHFTEWGAHHRETVVAWHGLARTARDMDEVAQHLCSRYRVICPDTLGRGLSQWSPEPEQEYQLSFYVKLATSLVDQLKLDRMFWLGTSMGGAIGMLAAGTTLRGRVQGLVLNDIGPQLAEPAIARIRDYAGQPPSFERVTELEDFLRTVYQPYGWMSDAQWRRMAETSTRRLPGGRVTTHYDPAIAMQFARHPRDYDLWPVYDSLDIPVLCLRGAESDLLLPEVAEAMQRRGPCATVVTVPGCGHAPALNVPAQWDLVSRFLYRCELVQRQTAA